MPWDKVFDKFKAGALHSGGPSGPVVKNRNQAIAIELSEKKKAAEGDSEYVSRDHPVRKLARRAKFSKS
jgi:hypothetical protein